MAEPVNTPDNKPADKPTESVKDAAYWENVAKEAIAGRKQKSDLAKTYETELAQLRSEKAEREAAKQQEAEEKNKKDLEAKGQYEQIIEQNRQKYDAEKKSINDRLSKVLVPDKIKAAAAKIEGIVPSAIDDLPHLLKDCIQVDPNTFEVTVLGSDGKPKLDAETGKPVNYEKFVRDYVTSKDYLMLDTMAKGLGTKAGGPKGNGSGFTVEAARANPAVAKAWKEADPEGYKAAIAAATVSLPEKLRKERAQQNKTVRAM